MGSVLLSSGPSPVAFGREAVNRRDLNNRSDLGTDPGADWQCDLVSGRRLLAIGHLSSALACFVTIIGIPLGSNI